MLESNWHGYEAKPFLFEGREAIVVFPKKARPGNPWTLKTEYRTAFPDVELRLLARMPSLNARRCMLAEASRLPRLAAMRYNL